MSARCNIAIKLKEKDLNKELTFDDIHFLKTKEEYPFMEVYCHQDGQPDKAKEFFFNRGKLTDYESVLKYILQGDRESFDTPYTECGKQWSDNRPYLFASLDGDIPELFYYIFMDDKWYFMERVSANDQQAEWKELVADDIVGKPSEEIDFSLIANEIRSLVERLTDGRYTTRELTEDTLQGILRKL